MIIGAGLDSRLGLSFADLRRIGVEAVGLGFESLWTTAGGMPDALHVCAAWSQASREATGSSVRTGIAVVPAPRQWKPLTLATQAATVGEISEGAFVLGIGTGGAGAEHFAAFGMPNRPIAIMRDFLEILRPLLAGEEIAYDGPVLQIERTRIGRGLPRVPVYLAALGPQMLHLAGSHADGVSLNWATPTQIAEARREVEAAAESVGRDPATVTVSMYIRVCVDDDVDAARRAFASQVLGYAMARPGTDKTLAYRGLFGRMGFDDALNVLEERRDRGQSVEQLLDDVPEELLSAAGYYGSAAGAASSYAALSEGLDETIVRVITTRHDPDKVRATLAALTPAKIREA